MNVKQSNKPKQKREYIVPCRIVRNTEVIVTAADEEEARLRFEDMDWIEEDARNIGQIVNWKINGKIKENE